ncbi:MAG: serine hydrolase domain-containing protein [Chitinophagales bacterium]
MRKLFLAALGICLYSMAFAQHLQNALDSFFRSYYAPDAPGAAIAISMNGKIIFKKAYGLADLHPETPISNQTNFNVGSLTKQFTAFCILKLVSEKRIFLTDKLIKYFPSFNKKVGSAITIRQMLCHSSGLFDHYDYMKKANLVHAGCADVLNAVEQLDSTYFEPGSAYRYSNTAYCLLALIIEKVSGLPYGEYLKKNIFVPLDMTHSIIWKSDKSIYKRAFGYDRNGKQQTFVRSDADESVFFTTEGDGGLYTSIDDYLKWIFALEGGRIIGQEWIDKARSPQFLIDSLNRLSYGFGWFINQKAKDKAVYHSGSNGGFRAISFTIPAQKTAIVIFSNRADIDQEKLLLDLIRILHINDKYFTKIESFVSFMDCWTNFAPCKEIKLYSTSYIRNLSASVMELN